MVHDSVILVIAASVFVNHATIRSSI